MASDGPFPPPAAAQVGPAASMSVAASAQNHGSRAQVLVMALGVPPIGGAWSGASFGRIGGCLSRCHRAKATAFPSRCATDAPDRPVGSVRQPEGTGEVPGGMSAVRLPQAILAVR